MTDRLFSHVEEYLKRLGKISIEHAEKLYGVELFLHLPVEDVRSRVYGKEYNRIGDSPIEFIGILIGDDFFTADSTSAGGFSEGFLLTQCKEIRTGSVVEVKRRDNKIRKYKINRRESVGITDEVFTQWAISAMGD